MNNYKIIVVTLILTAVLSLPACGGAPVNQPDSEDITPQSHAETNLSLVAVSDEWELEITGAIWGGDSSMIQIGEGQKQLFVFTNLTYVGVENDVPVPAFGVNDGKGSPFVVFASFGYGSSVPEGGENWISSFVTGNPATRHFTPGESFRPLMFTFAGPQDTQTFIFFFDDLTLDFTSVVESK
ncbi:MAG: hypothetical protein DCC59_06835 [Chloroflexi bacterium]|nr:hypothetical protein [Chloroflexi bacterium CFX1]MCK6568083.1 hypothetical protein [Anaerolineales bacterium]MCQ3952573.1 hypothetical protein [Chloroflexota bacterium]MDL1919749.1 hypothetical protein [Chloroflexi bacterium CFX5]NUQ58370.1 hypothetical protein [Anaerolineales bacterium]